MKYVVLMSLMLIGCAKSGEQKDNTVRNYSLTGLECFSPSGTKTVTADVDTKPTTVKMVTFQNILSRTYTSDNCIVRENSIFDRSGDVVMFFQNFNTSTSQDCLVSIAITNRSGPLQTSAVNLVVTDNMRFSDSGTYRASPGKLSFSTTIQTLSNDDQCYFVYSEI